MLIRLGAGRTDLIERCAKAKVSKSGPDNAIKHRLVAVWLRTASVTEVGAFARGEHVAQTPAAEANADAAHHEAVADVAAGTENAQDASKKAPKAVTVHPSLKVYEKSAAVDVCGHRYKAAVPQDATTLEGAVSLCENARLAGLNKRTSLMALAR